MAGGLALFWNAEKIDVDVLDSSQQCIHTTMMINSVRKVFSFVYDRPSCAWKDCFWVELKVFAETIDSPRCFLGDFNERWGGSASSHDVTNRVVNFKDRWSSCDLLDVDTSGCRFTWVRKNGGRIILQEKT
ncbi:hypothetical protein PVK06_039349 [Gossypium arboreum]|uniref:Endonuclease/exonuclease/phosphatase domain-containing protein n=1 Tax=Gossypium arboreum TaxID=29729 RepID=A0ABR0N2M1_GOSAR|nr:hypothetical protein PVK06_039349 [Gossypium arboreum]